MAVVTALLVMGTLVVGSSAQTLSVVALPLNRTLAQDFHGRHPFKSATGLYCPAGQLQPAHACLQTHAEVILLENAQSHWKVRLNE